MAHYQEAQGDLEDQEGDQVHLQEEEEVAAAALLLRQRPSRREVRIAINDQRVTPTIRCEGVTCVAESFKRR